MIALLSLCLESIPHGVFLYVSTGDTLMLLCTPEVHQTCPKIQHLDQVFTLGATGLCIGGMDAVYYPIEDACACW